MSTQDRRSFLRQTAAAIFAFVGTGWVLTQPGEARAAEAGARPNSIVGGGGGYVSCQKGNVYCKLVGRTGNFCSYECYDTYSLEYCYAFCEPC